MTGSTAEAPRLRLACDTGGTFTDLVVEDDAGTIGMFKAPTTPEDPIDGVLAALGLAAADRQIELADFLALGDVLVHGTTHAINAILTGSAARTAFLTTAGHPDVLLLREGSRPRAFDHRLPYPKPYVPRALTFEVPGRLDARGHELAPLDEEAVVAISERLAELAVEAVAVCLLWSIVEPAHEQRVGELLAEHLPHVPVTLSHELNPSWREYRRASSAAIDASLKPLMGRYLGSLVERLEEAGFRGRVLGLTSQGGVMDAAALARTPIHALNSGPALAPVAGAHYARAEAPNGGTGTAGLAIVADTGGTTYDVSLVRGESIPWTRETWIGGAYQGHMTGFPSVDVRSIGAGGGSIAWVDAGGVLHVGPQSAGADPGPACYGKGGGRATVTDASLVLGHLDPGYFLGGAVALDAELGREALRRDAAGPLGLTLEEAASAVLEVATESMVQAILAITVNQGIDPARATLVGGGGAAGLNGVLVARRLRCPRLVIPETGAALSAAGALMSRLTSEHRAVHFTTTADFDADGVAVRLAELEARCRSFLADAGGDGEVVFGVEARYANQAWEIPVELGPDATAALDVEEISQRFHRAHRDVFAIDDPSSIVELVSWSARASADVRGGRAFGRLADDARARHARTARHAYLPGEGAVEIEVLPWGSLEPGVERAGPAIVESPFTTVVLDGAARFALSATGNLVIRP